MKTYVITWAIEAWIGEAITSRILSEWHKVIGTYEKELSEKASTFSDNNTIELYEVDHGNKESLLSFTSSLKWTKIDGVINVQMLFEMEDLNNFSHDLYDKLVYVNLNMPNLIIHELKDSIKTWWSIVLITSTEAFSWSFWASAYASSKADLHNLIKTHANNLWPQWIRINAVVAWRIGGVMDTDEIFNLSKKITPLWRLGTPEEIASASWFLLWQEASFITWTTLVVDGGYTGVDTTSKYEFEAEQKAK